ncbi:MAG TPA: metallophosphoesterase [Solirubrobacteraceae bacterium]|nr:metallophosphoesterase [Solirubrobacteraceae bacterium]
MQPLPGGQGGRAHAADLGITDQSPVTFLVIGDSGGVKDPNPQNAVSNAMQARAPQDPKPAFVYTVGDIVYFNGDATEYTPQFYEAYGHLQLPIVGIPGNHDGDTTDDPTRKPLDTFMANFCAPKAALPPGNEEYNRDVETQPYCDWTLLLNAATVIGIYTNIPSGGHLEQSQVDWLTAELAAAPAGKPLIVTCHHPPYSVDQMHGGSQVIGGALDGAFASSGRTADLVLSGHVHDYQRFTRTLNGKQIPYIVIGNSGYHNLHLLANGATPGTQLSPGVVFEFGDDQGWGFLELTIDGTKVTGGYTAVTTAGQATPNSDRFTIG